MLKNARFVVVLCLMALSVAAWAAPASAAPSAWSFVDVGLHLEQGQPLLLVSGDLPDNIPLPYEAELAVPAGMQLQWIGEVLGGPPDQDPKLPYVKTTVGDMDIYRFTLTTSRTAQIEGVAIGATGADGQNQTSTLKWTAWQDVPSVRIAQRLPRGSQVVQPSDGASMQAGDEDFSYYSKTVADVKAGDVLDLAFAYTLPTGAPSDTAGGSTETITISIVAGMLLLVAVLLFVVTRRKPSAEVAETAGAKPAPKAASAQASKARPSAAAVVAESEPESTGRAAGRMSPKLAMLGALVVVVVVVLTSLGGGSVKDGRISKFFGATSPCSSTSLALMPTQGVDLTKRGDDIVDSFTGYEGIGDVTLTIATSTLDVTYCSSSHTPEAIRKIVEGSGLVTLAAAPVSSAPTTATVDPTGTKQTAAVDTSTGAFDPGIVVLQAGLPAEIAFGTATGCLTEVIFTSLGITQDLTAGPATVSLPALEPGTYAFACSMGHQEGSIVVQ